MERRYDIDWLRVIAITLLLVYHIGLAFQPWGVFIGFIQNSEQIKGLWAPMSMLNIWRIPLLFFVSGMGVCFAIQRRNWKQLLLERSRRILLPFIFGLLAIVPVHILLWQKYYSQELSYVLHPVHLWFLANIFIYVILLSPLFFFLKKREEGRIGNGIRTLFGKPLGLLLIVAVMVLEALAFNPETYATFSLSLHGFVVGLLVFLFGFILIYSGEAARVLLINLRWISLLLGLALYILRYIIFDLTAPNYMLAIESCSWIYAAFGFGFKYLNRPGKALTYLSQAAYPVYILHMVCLYLGSYFILPLDLHAALKFILIICFTFLSCILTYELIIRRVSFLRPLFGLKVRKTKLKSERKALLFK